MLTFVRASPGEIFEKKRFPWTPNTLNPFGLAQGVRQAAVTAVGRVAPKGHGEAIHRLRDLAHDEDDAPWRN